MNAFLVKRKGFKGRLNKKRKHAESDGDDDLNSTCLSEERVQYVDSPHTRCANNRNEIIFLVLIVTATFMKIYNN